MYVICCNTREKQEWAVCARFGDVPVVSDVTLHVLLSLSAAPDADTKSKSLLDPAILWTLITIHSTRFSRPVYLGPGAYGDGLCQSCLRLRATWQKMMRMDGCVCMWEAG